MGTGSNPGTRGGDCGGGLKSFSYLPSPSYTMNYYFFLGRCTKKGLGRTAAGRHTNIIIIYIGDAMPGHAGGWRRVGSPSWFFFLFFVVGFVSDCRRSGLRARTLFVCRCAYTDRIDVSIIRILYKIYAIKRTGDPPPACTYCFTNTKSYRVVLFRAECI